MDKAALLDFVIEVVRRIDNEPGSRVLPRRWVVERNSAARSLAKAGARSRTATRRLRGNDPRCNGKPSAAPDQPLMQFSNGL